MHLFCILIHVENNSNIKLSINELTGDYKILHNGFSWVSDGRRPYIILRKKVGGKFISTYRDLYSALKKSFEYVDTKIVTRLSNYVAFGKNLDFTLILTARITGENTVEFSLKAENETGYDIQAVYFPAPLIQKRKAKTLIILMQCEMGLYCLTDIRKICFQQSALSTI